MYGYMRPKSPQITPATIQTYTEPVEKSNDEDGQFTVINPNIENLHKSMSEIADLRQKDADARLKVTVQTIKAVCASQFGFLERELESDARGEELVYARHVAFYICRYVTVLSLPRIGRPFGDRDHTTVLHGIRKLEKRLKAGDYQVFLDIHKAIRPLRSKVGLPNG